MDSNISELVKLGHERADELKAACGAVDVRSVAQLISDLASHLEVQYVRAEESQREFRAADATIENLQMQVEKLAAENAGLKSEVPMGAIENGRAFADWLEAYQFECQGGNLNMCSDWQELLRCFEHLSEWAMHGQPETPATDAFLAEVRAQGVDEVCMKIYNATSNYYQEGEVHGLEAATFICDEFAAQLRKGAQS